MAAAPRTPVNYARRRIVIAAAAAAAAMAPARPARPDFEAKDSKRIDTIASPPRVLQPLAMAFADPGRDAPDPFRKKLEDTMIAMCAKMRNVTPGSITACDNLSHCISGMKAFRDHMSELIEYAEAEARDREEVLTAQQEEEDLAAGDTADGMVAREIARQRIEEEQEELEQQMADADARADHDAETALLNAQSAADGSDNDTVDEREELPEADLVHG